MQAVQSVHEVHSTYTIQIYNQINIKAKPSMQKSQKITNYCLLAVLITIESVTNTFHTAYCNTIKQVFSPIVYSIVGGR